MSNSLWPHGMQHARLPCPFQTPGTYSNTRPLGQWCHPTISSSVTPFSSCPQSLPASRSFPMSWFFTSSGQSIGVSASASVLPMSIQDWSPLGLNGWISLQSKGLSRIFSNTTVQKHQFFGIENAIIWILIRRDREKFDLTEKSFLSCVISVITEAEAGMMQPQSRKTGDQQKLEVKRNTFSPRPSGEYLGLSAHWFQPSETDYRLLAARKGDSTFLLFSSHEVCGSLLQ